MKSNNDELDLVIWRLRGRKPEIAEPSRLTDQIMREIRAQSAGQQPPKRIYWLRYVSSVASVFLLALLAYQQSNGNENAVSRSDEQLRLCSEIYFDGYTGVDFSGSDCKTLYSDYLHKKRTQKNIRKRIINSFNYENNR
jgi:hypothetical protein